MMNGLPRWQVVRQQAPGTAAADYVEDSVEDLAQRVDSGPSIGLRIRQIGLYASPLGVR